MPSTPALARRYGLNFIESNEITGSPAVANGKIYFVASTFDFPSTGTLYALDLSTHQALWQRSWPDAAGTPVVGNGAVYFNSTALNANTGALLWNTPVVFFGLPALSRGVLYVGSNDNNLYALNASTGATEWSYRTGNFVSSPPAVANGVVYVESDDGNFYALDAATGAHLWHYPISTYHASGPAVANGRVYIGSQDQNLYVFHLPGQ